MQSMNHMEMRVNCSTSNSDVTTTNKQIITNKNQTKSNCRQCKLCSFRDNVFLYATATIPKKEKQTKNYKTKKKGQTTSCRIMYRLQSTHKHKQVSEISCRIIISHHIKQFANQGSSIDFILFPKSMFLK